MKVTHDANIRRQYGLDARQFCPGFLDESWTRLFLYRSGAQEKRSQHTDDDLLSHIYWCINLADCRKNWKGSIAMPTVK